MPEHDRDESVDRLLKRTLRGAANPSTPATCADGETLAAWTAGALRSHEAAAVEQHLADCDRCQAMLSTFVRTTPAAPPAEPLWHRWRLQWLVPLATAATALALWVAMPTDRPSPTAAPEPEAQVASRLEAPALAPEPSSPSTSQAVGPPAGSASANAVADRVEPQLPQTAASPVPAEPVGRLGRAEQETRIVDEQSVRRDAGAAARSRESFAIAPTAPAKAAEADADTRKQNQGTVEINTPGAAPRWRITGGGQIERATPDGLWEPVTLPSPALLTAGSAPSASVCWLAGRGGAVFLTTDGVRFTRTSFPEVVDLVAVSATDERSATVTASDGRTWRTTDQGRTWTR